MKDIKGIIFRNKNEIVKNLPEDIIKDLDFLPLTVDYEERQYAAGKIPGG